ncbi:MAG: NADP-dependent methylenetetrahydromethanopterin/methylenetetrahydrofolate dehydrogenase [Gammaproteobacteria bacterium]|nr:NADP-dependent methylenetetrahydromethanopterin/methylenetetrahydrofolate dehydrogenase [Gammaproteobacteria bacterium]
MKKLLFQLDTDPLPSAFDTVVGYDGGADHVIPYGNVAPDNVEAIVDGTIFTRSPKEKKNTAIFIGGSDLAAGERLLEVVQKRFFTEFRVSVMLDSNGSNTTAAAAVALLCQARPVTDKRVVVLAGTGPVGQRAALFLTREGARVVLTSRNLARAEQACALLDTRYGAEVTPTQVSDDQSMDAALDNAQIVFAAGAAGVQLLGETRWQQHPTIEMLADVNATPPLGIEGIKMNDKGAERHGKVTFGAIGLGALKLRLHRTCVATLFTDQNQLFDAESIYAVAKSLLK